MVDRRYVVHDPDRNRWGLGPAAAAIGSAGPWDSRRLDRARLVEAAGPALRRLRTEDGAVLAIVAVRDGPDALVIAVEPAPGFTTVAAPIVDHLGTVIASLGVEAVLPDELTEYHREFNAESIDGLPTPLGGLLAASPPDVTPPA